MAEYSVRALQRAVQILRSFTPEAPERTLTEISRDVGLHKATVFRLLAALMEGRLVEQDPRTGRYRLGIGVFELGSIWLGQVDIVRIARPLLEELATAAGMSAHLGVLDEGEVVYLAKVEPPNAFILQPSQVGKRIPAHCTALGKCMLSDLPPEGLHQVLEKKGLPAMTPHTITSLPAMEAELARVREQGYALDQEEIQEGLMCVAAPILDHTGRVVAAISLSGFVPIFVPRQEWLREQVMATARRVSEQLGYQHQTKNQAGPRPRW